MAGAVYPSVPKISRPPPGRVPEAQETQCRCGDDLKSPIPPCARTVLQAADRSEPDLAKLPASGRPDNPNFPGAARAVPQSLPDKKPDVYRKAFRLSAEYPASQTDSPPMPVRCSAHLAKTLWLAAWRHCAR